MKDIYKLKSLSFPTKIAIGSFVGGTLLFLGSFIFPAKTDYYLLGLLYVLAAILINFSLLIFLIYRLLTNPKLRKKTIMEVLFVISNIPIAFLYFFIIYNFNNLF